MEVKTAELETALTAAIAQALETMAFEQVQLVAEKEVIPAAAGDEIWVSIPLLKPYQGELIMETSQQCARELAQALYSAEVNELSPEIISDTLGEMLNTIAGIFLQELLGDGQDFEIGFPQIGRHPHPQREDLRTSLLFELSGHILRAAVAGNSFNSFVGSKESAAEVQL